MSVSLDVQKKLIDQLDRTDTKLKVGEVKGRAVVVLGNNILTRKTYSLEQVTDIILDQIKREKNPSSLEKNTDKYLSILKRIYLLTSDTKSPLNEKSQKEIATTIEMISTFLFCKRTELQEFKKEEIKGPEDEDPFYDSLDLDEVAKNLERESCSFLSQK